MFPREITVEQQWFWQLFVSVFVCIGNGAQFCFGIFSPYMKSGQFKFTQEQLNTVSTVGTVLSYFSQPTGYLYDRCGPRVTLAVGGITSFIGWTGMYLIFVNEDKPLLGTSVFVMSLCYGICNYSASFFETGSVLTNLEAFSLHQGRIIMIQKTFLGLGSSIISQLYIAFFQDYAVSTFFLFLGVFTTFVGLYGAYVTKLPTPETRVVGLNCKSKYVSSSSRSNASRPADDKEQSLVPRQRDDSLLFDLSFKFGVGTTTLIVFFIATASIVEEYVVFSRVASVLMGVATILLVVAFGGMVIFSPTGLQHTAGPEKGAAVNNSSSDAGPVDVYHGDEVPEMDQLSTTSTYQGIVGRNGAVWFLNDSPLSVNIRTPELALMWVVSFGVWGTTTLITSNSSQIYQSLDFEHYKATTNVVYVSIFGVASALGRLIVGFVQPILVSKGIHTVTMFPIAPVINIVALPLFFIMPANSIILPFFLTGLATGVTWGSTVLIIKSLFHPKHTGMHYNVLYTAGMLTPIVMNIALFGPLYDKHGKEQGLSATHSCRGTVCVVIPMMVSLAFNVVAFAAAYIFYRRVLLKGGI